MNAPLRPTAVPLYDAAAARAGDAAAVAQGDTWYGLMDRAAGHLARHVVDVGGHGYGLRVAVIAGRGDNGGDGWAVARRLQREYGAQAWVVAVDGVDSDVSQAAAAHRAAWLRTRGRVSGGDTDLAAALDWSDVAVDAVLGTGARGAPRGPASTAVSALVTAGLAGTPVVACDVPSGVNADDGSVDEPRLAVAAVRTVTFGCVKRGLLLHPGAAHAGRIVVGELGDAYDAGETAWATLTPAGAVPPPLLSDVDKRSRGVVHAVAGSSALSGAAALVGTAAVRAGAGLVTVTTPAAARDVVAARSVASVMVRAAADEGGVLAPGALEQMDIDADVVVAGPGMGTGPGTRDAVDVLLARGGRIVLDADALNVFRDDPQALRAGPAMTLVVTPHARELARIGGDGDDRAASAVRLASERGAIVVAKGPGTVVAAPDGRVWVCPLGSAALGSGGTGDVLAGIIAAAIARAEDPALATAQAVWWHAAAGELAGTRTADRATADDVLAVLPRVLQLLAAGTPGAAATPGSLPWDDWRGVWRDPVADRGSRR